MKTPFLLLLSTLLVGLCVGIPSYYHTAVQIEQSLENLQTTCKNDFKLETLLESPKIQIVTITKRGDMDKLASKQKVFYLFGEHARELISSETGMSLVNTLCGVTEASIPDLDEVLEKNAFQFVLNANPLGRALVEQGHACQRTNEHGVDLNRNWDAHWETSHDGNPDTNPGKKAFSEIESTRVKEALEKFQPHIFATIHSGTLGMYTPYAYSMEPANYNEIAMLKILTTLNDKYCACDVGAAGAKVGYLCPGTCLDYAYDHIKVPYSYAFEIYSASKMLPAVFRRTSLLQMKSKTAKKAYVMGQMKEVPSCFIQTSSKTTQMSDAECFFYFNPDTEDRYRVVVDNWTKALLDLAGHVHIHRQNYPPQSATQC